MYLTANVTKPPIREALYSASVVLLLCSLALSQQSDPVPDRLDSSIESSNLMPVIVYVDRDGRLDQGEVGELLQKASDIAPTDLFVMAHGWNNTEATAKASYLKMIQLMSELASQHQLRPEGFRPLSVGIRWPSKAWIDDAEAAAGREAQAEAPLGTELDPRLILALYDVLSPEMASEEQWNQDMMRMEQLLLKPANSDAQIMEAAQIVRRYMPQADVPDDGIFLERAFAAGAEADGVLGKAFGSVVDIVRIGTYWQMKARAGRVGANGVRELLEQLQSAHQFRVHLFGHSFGAKVMLSAVTTRPLPRPVQTLVLLQPAVSHEAFAPTVSGTNRPGGYRSALDPDRVSGPIVVTFSALDVPLNRHYPLASAVAGDFGEVELAILDKYSALGANGAVKLTPNESARLSMKSVGEEYEFSGRRLFSVDGGPPNRFISGHSEIFNTQVAWLLWQSVKTSMVAAAQPNP